MSAWLTSDIARAQHAKAKFLNLKGALERLGGKPPWKAKSTFFKSGAAGTTVCHHMSRLLFT
jgi:hypothetical protein